MTRKVVIQVASAVIRIVSATLIAVCIVSAMGCSLYTGEIRQCPAGWPQDVFNKIDEVKSVCLTK